MNISILDTFSEIKSEKMIDNPTITNILEDVFRSEIIKKFGSDENFDFVLNPSNGDFEIWQVKEVVNDEDFKDNISEAKISEVLKIENDFEVGEEYSEKLNFQDLGRRSILNIKQSLKFKFKEYTNIKTSNKFKDMIGSIYSGEISYIKRNVVILTDDNGDEILLPKENQIKGEFYKKGSILTGIIESSEVINNKPIIKMSRSSNKFLQCLLEEEVPEISDGLISIKKIHREPGVKSKVIVETYDDRIDPVGICVGMNGNRINRIVTELSGENIDIINHTENLNLLVTRCLKPAKVEKIEVDDECLNVYLDVNEIGKAVGKGGVNVRLTSKITGYEVNIINNSYDTEKYIDIPLREFNDEIDDWVIDEFIKIGLDTGRSVLNYKASTLESSTDLEVETINNVIKIIKDEFEKDE